MIAVNLKNKQDLILNAGGCALFISFWKVTGSTAQEAWDHLSPNYLVVEKTRYWETKPPTERKAINGRFRILYPNHFAQLQEFKLNV